MQLREKNEKDERRRRTLANAVKQARAAQWIKDNIIANQVNQFENVIGSTITASKYNLFDCKLYRLPYLKFFSMTTLTKG